MSPKYNPEKERIFYQDIFHVNSYFGLKPKEPHKSSNLKKTEGTSIDDKSYYLKENCKNPPHLHCSVQKRKALMRLFCN